MQDSGFPCHVRDFRFCGVILIFVTPKVFRPRAQGCALATLGSIGFKRYSEGVTSNVGTSRGLRASGEFRFEFRAWSGPNGLALVSKNIPRSFSDVIFFHEAFERQEKSRFEFHAWSGPELV